MSNDEYLMTKETRMTKIGPKNQGNSPFELRQLFGVRLPRRSRAKAGHWSLVISSATRLMLVLFVALSLSCSGKRITKANVDQVSEGMSKKQVESILGPPTSLRTEVTTKMTTYVYRQGKDTVTILFKDDKVQSKDSTLSD
jgi:hypothetical protein